MAPIEIMIPLVDYDPYDAVRVIAYRHNDSGGESVLH